MKKNILVCLLVLATFLGCKKTEEKNFYLVNVLNKEFFDDAHIPGSISVPFSNLMAIAQKWPKEAQIVLYCSNPMCLASGEGARQLTKLGFKNVKAYESGIAHWYQAGLPVVGKAEKDYLKKIVEAEPEQESYTINTLELEELLKVNNLLK